MNNFNLIDESEVELQKLLILSPLLTHQVSASEVDFFNVTHYSRYYVWMSDAMFNLFKYLELDSRGFDSGTVEYRVARVQASYIKSARLGDIIYVELHRITIKQNFIVVYFRITADNQLLMRSRIKFAFIDGKSKVLVNVPKDLLKKFFPN
jgi:acyl-CoA thioesterase FadM